jgi:hypothetical protein
LERYPDAFGLDSVRYEKELYLLGLLAKQWLLTVPEGELPAFAAGIHSSAEQIIESLLYAEDSRQTE